MTKAKRTAVVTGASSGIGAAYADRLAARGYDLVLVARRGDRLERLAETLSHAYGNAVETAIADLANEHDLDAIDAIVADAPNIDLLVNCAGMGALGPGVVVDPSKVDVMLKVNVLALTRLSLTAARRFANVRCGTIINIGSIVAVMPVPGAGSYSGSKAYVLNFSRSLQAEVASSNVKVQVVMPGPVRSEFFGDTPAPFPDQLFMTAETLVDTALKALDQEEMVCFPTLHDIAAWEHLEGARSNLVKAVTQTGMPAERYQLRS